MRESKNKAIYTKIRTFSQPYVYDLSKRTSLYAGATYAWGDKAFDKNGNASNAFATESDSTFNEFRSSLNGYQVGLGINHTF